jgi:hypothetical protein
MAVDDPIVMPGPDPRVGVVVLTHNRAAEVVRTLERLVVAARAPGDCRYR